MVRKVISNLVAVALFVLLAASQASAQAPELEDIVGIGFGGPAESLNESHAEDAYDEAMIDFYVQAMYWADRGWDTMYINNEMYTEYSGGQAMYVCVFYGIRWLPEEDI